ncbi:MAG: hypothetical protein HY282_06505 [Nitrospirae bacterium]|nr:hypothetical protein [Candidatus Manganitrophaceae bacterium]
MNILIVLIALIVRVMAGPAEAAAAGAFEAPVSSPIGYTLSEKYLLPPGEEVKLAKYVSLLPSLMKDWTQTLQLGHRGFEENNPLLGRQPTAARINRYFFIYTLSILAAFYLPEPFSSSILDTIRYQEEIVVFENERLFNREAAVTSAPLAFMVTIRY